jgi:uncharacterized membrane protein SpoIIM required for sporulation
MRKFLKERKYFIILFLFCVLGIILGTWFVNVADEKTLSLLSSLTGGQLQNGAGTDTAEFVFFSISGDLLVLVVMFILGFSPISLPIIISVAVFCAVGVGASAGYIYTTFSSIVYNAVLIAPSSALSLLGVCFAGEEAIKMSGCLFSRIFKDDTIRINTQKIYKYSLNFLSFSCIIILSGILDTALNKIFYNVITL